MSKLSLEGRVGVDWVEIERGIVGRGKKCSKPERHEKLYLGSSK